MPYLDTDKYTYNLFMLHDCVLTFYFMQSILINLSYRMVIILLFDDKYVITEITYVILIHLLKRTSMGSQPVRNLLPFVFPVCNTTDEKYKKLQFRSVMSNDQSCPTCPTHGLHADQLYFFYDPYIGFITYTYFYISDTYI